jgi:hypothetical protein
VLSQRLVLALLLGILLTVLNPIDLGPMGSGPMEVWHTMHHLLALFLTVLLWVR